ncbi:unnamed protein product [Vicia faba]|uniref:JmjC domain-containing protein n=1 Tax=Vicia faba TaxID=3906 RepID=A0AAV0ZE99_VICFA|nr:unnamed protein product [Vicia faba]
MERLELKEVQKLEGHTDRVWSLDWNPATGHAGVPLVFASCSGDKTGNEPVVIARGGFTGLFPEGSREAIGMSKEISIFLCNVQFTKDAGAFCVTGVKLDNATTIATFDPNEKTYNINGKDVQGHFMVDYTAAQIDHNVSNKYRGKHDSNIIVAQKYYISISGYNVSSLVDGMCNIACVTVALKECLFLSYQNMQNIILLFSIAVQHLIAEVSEIMTNDTVDKAGLWKNKLIDQSLELLDYLPQAIQDICFLKEIHMEMFKYLKLHIIIFCVHLSSLSNFESVADCDTRDFTDKKREDMLVSDFVRLCFKYEGSAVQCSNQIGVSNGDSASVPYLKDWHFVKEYPDYVPYITPMFFCDDWLNLYLDNFRTNTYSDRDQQNKEICCSDYRFVYMGVKGSWTPLHADVFRSYSWSANVCGKKRWFFLDPSQCHLVFDRNMKSCVYNIFDEVSDSKYPSFKKAIWLECTQEAGEIIFVPSGWLDLGNGKTLDLERCSRSKLRKQCIKYLGPQERENYEYVVCDGKIINNQSGDFLHTKKDSEDAKWIFVMSTEKKLYAGKKKKGLFHHSSFLAGGATLAAGRLEAEDGVLKSISAYSGHYRPTDETLDAFLSYLRENGVNLVTFHEFCVGMRSLDQMVVKEGSWS